MFCNPLLEAHRELQRLATIFHRPIVCTAIVSPKAGSTACDRSVDSFLEGAR